MNPRRVLSASSLNAFFRWPTFLFLFVAMVGPGRALAQVSTSNVPFLPFEVYFHRSGTEAELRRYTLAGPIDGERLFTGVRLVRVGDRGQFFGVDRNTIVELDRATGTFRSVDYNEVSPTLAREGWATGVAYDSISDQVALVSLGSEGYLHNYSPTSDSWTLMGDLDNWDFDSIVHHRAEDVLYGVRCSNLGGAATGSLQIARIAKNGQPSPAILIPNLTFGVGFGGHSSELVSVGEYLVLLLEPGKDYHYSEGPEESRIYLIHPGRGDVKLTYRKVWEQWPPPSAPPTVRIISPENGAHLNSGSTVKLVAIASGPNPIQSVEFLANDQYLGRAQLRTTPTGQLQYELSWTPPNGTYVLKAVATDSTNARGTSDLASVIVKAGEGAFSMDFFPVSGLSVSEGHVFTRHYNSNGPVGPGRLLPGMRVVQAADGNYYGTYYHAVYRIEAGSGRAEEMGPSYTGEFELSWPMGLTYDSKRNRILLVSLGGQGFLYEYVIAERRWNVIASMENKDIDSILYDPGSDEIFAFGHNRQLYRLNAQGQVVGSFQIGPVDVHVGPGAYQSEMALMGDKIALLIEPDYYWGIQAGHESRLFIIDPAAQTSLITFHHVWTTQPENIPPTVQITHPVDGMNFEVGSTVTLTAQAGDLDGYVIGVEFFANGVRVGAASAQDAGTNAFTVPWKPLTNGAYSIYARAMDDRGAKVDSTPVGIRAGLPEPTETVVRIVASDPEGTEFSPLAEAFDPVRFTIMREGDRARSLTIFYSIHGTAKNGIDYHEIPTSATIPAGEGLVEVVIVPKGADSDTVLPNEKMETVGIRIEPSPMAGPLPTYEIDPLVRSAAAVIYERTRPQGGQLEVAIPGAGTTYHDEVKFLLAGYHPTRDVPLVDYYVDGQKVGSSQNETDPTEVGGYVVHIFEWTSATVGQHVLEARAILSNGVVLNTSRIPFVVQSAGTAAFVHRELPESYSPGLSFVVFLRANPPQGTHAYAVEDAPPAGWQVVQTSFEGTIDPVSKKVKFGPFTDAQPRTLSYRVMPPTNAMNRAEFTGNSSRDGLLYPILGDRVIESRSIFHPADSDRNNAITITELTAYAAAWKAGDSWPAGPSPIPSAYVTRAAQIWKQGEVYRFNSLAPVPFCWEPNLFPLPPTPVFITQSAVSVERIAASAIAPGGTARVQINIAPPAESSAYAVEEKVPEGWIISEMSEGGMFDPASRLIRWGVFVDANARSFSYVLSAPEARASVAHLAGTISIDGGTRAITGSAFITASDATTAVRLVPARDATGALQLKVSSAAGQTGVIECSTDLIHWTELQPFSSVSGSVNVVDGAAGEIPARFYRFKVQ